ncbi:MAG: YggT family protein [bacterium]
MNAAFSILASISSIARTVLLTGGALLAVVAVADWAARTRRINPFNSISRFLRSNVDPRLAGVERQVLRSGGHASSTPLWALVAYVVIAALFLAALDMLMGLLRQAFAASTMGPTGILMLIIHWTFAFFRMALLVRVFGSWFPRAAASPWLRWSHGATEWMLRPLRSVIPSLGMIDITPIIAYFALSIIEGLIT